MAEWQAIETAPENKDILVYRDLSGGDYGVDKFQWHTRSKERSVSEHGNRRIYRTEEWKEQEWVSGWGWTHWQPLPAAPSQADRGSDG